MRLTSWEKSSPQNEGNEHPLTHWWESGLALGIYNVVRS
jgi:hypothetical protein